MVTIRHRRIRVSSCAEAVRACSKQHNAGKQSTTGSAGAGFVYRGFFKEEEYTMRSANDLIICTSQQDTSDGAQSAGASDYCFNHQTLDDTLGGSGLERAQAILIPAPCPITEAELHTLLDLSIPVFLADSHDSLLSSTDIANLQPLSWPPEPSYVEEKIRRLNRLQPFPLHIPSLPDAAEMHLHGLFGTCKSFAQCMRRLRKIAISHAPILIEGETGTGKELAARYLHYLGPKSGKPFIPVNCGSLPAGLFENELFGHEKGAYTDAKSSQLGLIEQADNGTLFLDEVNSLHPNAQAGLLRFLQDQQYRPLGSRKLKQANITVLAASNSDLGQQAEQGHFRKDLYYRLSSISINLPALRDRRPDIGTLARLFLRQLCEEYQQQARSLHPDSISYLQLQPWPGNVRQLKSLIHSEFLINDSRIIRIQEEEQDRQHSFGAIPARARQTTLKQARNDVIELFEQEYLHQLMLETSGNVTHAARLAGKERRSLGKLLKKYRIDRNDYMDSPRSSRDLRPLH